MLHPKLLAAMARFHLGMAEPSDLIDAAHDALNDGYYSYSLGELISQYAPNPQDSRRLFANALGELGAKLPSLDACVEIVLESVAIDIHEGRAEPFSALGRLTVDDEFNGRPRELFQFEGLNPVRLWLEHYHNLTIYRDYGFYSVPDRLDFSECDPEYQKLIANVVSFAGNWIEERNRPFLESQWRTSDVLGLAASIRDRDHAR